MHRMAKIVPETEAEVTPPNVEESDERVPFELHFTDGTMREGGTFWRDVFSFQNNVAPLILPRVLGFAAYAFLVSLLHRYTGWEPAEATVVELTGAFLAMMLVLRTNSGYDRWWEGRRLWAGMVNQSRNLAVTALAYGPRDASWQDRFIHWIAAYPHVCRHHLRNEAEMPEVHRLLGADAVARINASEHRPAYVSHVLAEMIGDAIRSGHINTAIYRQLELQRTALVDYVGSCERILRTRFPRIHRTMLGQLMVLYLLGFPWAIVADGMWSEALLTAAVAYSLFSLDQVARELGNPFSLRNRSHLPLNELTQGIEEQVLAMLHEPASLDALPLLVPKK